MQKIAAALILLTLSTFKTYADSAPAQGFADIVEPLMPTVVNVYTAQYRTQVSKKTPEAKLAPYSLIFNKINELLDNVEVPFGLDEIYSSPGAVALGSGFIIDENGYIVTNHHVVEGADEIYVKLSEGKEIQAKLIGSDARTDLALLKVEPATPLPYVKFGSSKDARVGDWVIAIGNPFGLGGTVTVGIISSKSRDINEAGIIDDFIQTDAAINNGNSGGPMFNLHGEVIGINTVIFSPSGNNIGIGFAIPSAAAQSVIKQLKEHGRVSRGFLSIQIQEVSPEFVEGLGLPEDTEGALVFDVDPGGSGEAAGLEPGDVIVSFNNVAVKNTRKLQIAVAEAEIDTDVPITILRLGKHINLTCRITDIDKKQHAVQTVARQEKDKQENDSTEKYGITFSNLTSELANKFGLKNLQGVIVSNINNNDNNWKKLSPGDLIVSVNQQQVIGLEDFKEFCQEALNAKRKNIVLQVKRHNQMLLITLPL